MSGQFAKVFFESFFSRFNEKNPIWVDAVTAKYGNIYLITSQQVLTNLILALDDALKSHVNDKKVQPKQALHYLQKIAAKEEERDADKLLKDLQQIQKTRAETAADENADLLAANQALIVSLTALLVKLSTADILDEAEQSQADRLATYGVQAQDKLLSDAASSEAAEPTAPALVAAFGNHVLAGLARMEKIPASVLSKLGTTPNQVLFKYGHDLMKDFKAKAHELLPQEKKGCVIM